MGTARRLALHTLAVEHPMGLQVYDEEIASRAPVSLGDSWVVSRRIGRTLRAPLDGNVRIPGAALTGENPLLRTAFGRLAYRGADVVHRMDLAFPPAPAPEVLTLHDTVAWRFPDEGAPPRTVHTEVRRAAAVICPSQHTADDISWMFAITPVVIPNGVGPQFFGASPLEEERLLALGLRRPYVLHAGGASLRKNLGALAQAWAVVQAKRPDVMLALSGPSNRSRDALFAPLAGAHRLGRIDQALVPGLVAAASAVVVPSLYEGFGLPALEAMAAGTPVVAARRSSLPEVCADAAILVEPDGRSLAEGILVLLDGDAPDDLTDRGRLRAQEFTWRRSALAHADVWKSLVS